MAIGNSTASVSLVSSVPEKQRISESDSMEAGMQNLGVRQSSN
jgi:hypothetical protein